MYIDVKKLYRLTAKKQMTMTELVKKAGISFQILGSIKRGWRSTTKTVGRLAAALGVEPEEILKDEE